MANAQTTEPIGALLAEEGLVTQEQVKQALAQQKTEGGKTFEILIRLGHLDKDALHTYLSKQSGVAAIDLSRFNIDKDLANLIPEELALRELVLPIDRLGKLLTVAMAYPLDTDTIARMEELTGQRVKAMLARFDDIVDAVHKCYGEDLRSGSMAMFQMPGTTGTSAAASTAPDLTGKIDKLASLAVAPATLSRVVEIADTPGAEAKTLAQHAAADPAFLAMLLRLANTAPYGLQGQVDSVGLAVALVGGDGVRALAKSLQLEAPRPKADMGSAYDRARRCGVAAAVLAKVSGKAERGLAHTAGVLYNLGDFVLATVAPQGWAATANASVEEIDQALGMTPGEAAERLALRWGIPRHLAEAIAHARGGTVAGEEDVLAVLITVSARLAEQDGAPGPGCLEGLEPLVARLGLKPEQVLEQTAKALAQ